MKLRTLTAEEKLEWLYGREINFRIECFFDAGYQAHIGDDENGIELLYSGYSLADAVDTVFKAGIRKVQVAKK